MVSLMPQMKCAEFGRQCEKIIVFIVFIMVYIEAAGDRDSFT